MSSLSLSLLQEYWIEELGCTASDLFIQKTKAVPHGTLKGYKGVYFFRLKNACIVSAPEDLFYELKESVADLRAQECFSLSAISRILQGQLDRIIGPAWIGGIDLKSFRPCHGTETSLVQNQDGWKNLEVLLAAVSPEEAQDSSLEIGRPPVVGVFNQGTLVAAAGYEILFGKVAHIGVLCHPHHRGKGFATKAISGITELALKSGLGIQYQTLCSNLPSIRAAQKIGFQEFAQTFAARLSE